MHFSIEVIAMINIKQQESTRIKDVLMQIYHSNSLETALSMLKITQMRWKDVAYPVHFANK